MKRILTFVMIAALALSGVMAGGQAETAETNAVTIWMGSWWEEYVPAIVEAYKEVAPDVELTIETLPVNGYVDKAVTTVIGGGGPDLVALDVTQMGALVGRNLLAPMDDIYAAIGGDDFASNIQGAYFDGKLYGIPYRCSASVMYYNKTIFDEAGIPYPEQGWTWEDMREIAIKLTIPGERYGVGIAASLSDPSNVTQMLNPILWAMGGDYLNEDGTKCMLDTPEAIAAVKFYTDLYTTDKCVPEGTINYSISRDVVPLFIDNRVAMFMGGDQNAVEFDASYPDLRYGFCYPPAGPVGVGGWVFSMPVTAKNPEGARDFLLWFMQPEILGTYAARIPARLSATEYGKWSEPIYKTIVGVAQNGRLSPNVPEWADMQKIIITELQNIMQGTKTVEAACKDMTVQCDQLLAD